MIAIMPLMSTLWNLVGVGRDKVPTAKPPALMQVLDTQDSKDRDVEAVEKGCRISFEIHGEVGEQSLSKFTKGETQQGGVLETTYGRRWYVEAVRIHVNGRLADYDEFELGKLYEMAPSLYFRRLS